MLPTVLQLVLFLFAIGFFSYIIRGINKNILLLKNALIQLLISIVLITFAIFLHVTEWLAMASGSETVPNSLSLVAVIVLLIVEIKNSVLISKHENHIETLLRGLFITKFEGKQENRERKND